MIAEFNKNKKSDPKLSNEILQAIVLMKYKMLKSSQFANLDRIKMITIHKIEHQYSIQY